jgi:uncharacterized membrane protein (UPF0127 family)
MRSLWFALSLAAATCQRVDEPSPPAPATDRAQTSASAAPAETTVATAAEAVAPAAPSAAPTTLPSTDSPDAVSAAPDAGRCIDPLVEPAPPPAPPASICPHDPLTSPPALKHGKIRVPEAKGTRAIDVEIASTPESEQRGLMYRTKLGAEQGMIFTWPSESIRTFWMHNTCLPLDMLFLAKDGTVVGLLEQVPTLNDRPRQVRCPAAYVLEMNAGWSRRHGVKPGMKLDIRL